MLKGVSPSTTVGTPYWRYQRESEPPTRMFTAGVSPSTSAATWAVRRRSGRFDLDPHQALLAEAHHPGRADIAADVGVAPRVRNVLHHVAGAERAHILLVARQGEHDLAHPGIAVLGE